MQREVARETSNTKDSDPSRKGIEMMIQETELTELALLQHAEISC